MSKRKGGGQFGAIGAKTVVLRCFKFILDERISLLIVGIRLAPPTGGGNAMKLQAHMPTVSIGAREWRAAMIALVSLLGLSALILVLRSGALVNIPLFERLGTSTFAHPHINVPRRISLDLHSLDHPLLAHQRTERQLKPSHDRLMLMLMLLRLRTESHS